ncbi:hypothetical protein [Thermochromatium tepidum]|jgi:hypothetical protein|uniref:Uncharacterized protein n=1 Tax=Thermochromatium tepidum ATCC 43061 TaxID=316276 RepID=A0A6I6E6Y4_THETI|nr:hypothetical protein [Thermochromatium tepidum]QGU33612.1 hypothetical protein E6P07_11875 [Thermochromatium tepidum ATCC 43061]
MSIKPRVSRRLASIFAALCIGVTGSAQALSLVVEDGEIAGVSGLDIQGRLYDVTFRDGAFNAIYPSELSGYGPLARALAQALLATKLPIQAVPGRRTDLRPRGCQSTDSCTILIPEHSDGTAPNARMTHTVEVIYTKDRFSKVPEPLWPFDADTDTQSMPDMLYAVITPAH